MSQKATRKSQNATAVTEEKVDTPVKEMKKKIAANAEKDKQASEKADKPTEKTDKSETADKSKTAEKPDKNGDKSVANEKQDNKDKTADKKTDKLEKVVEKKADKSEKVVEKKTDKSNDNKKTDKPVEKKTELQAQKDESKGDKAKEKPVKAVNGTHNGAAASNGDDPRGTVTVSDGSDDDDDDLFPELTYDDSDTDADEAPSRSLTRRSQVKATKTPETPAPRPASERESDDSKESKLLKLKEDAGTSDRKLRSADSPKPDHKKDKKSHDSPNKQDSAQDDEKKATKKDLETSKEDSAAEKKESEDGSKQGGTTDVMEVEVVVEVETTEGAAPRTRARVSPFSRTRLDRTATSVMADYTGNNSTMEMDITESSSTLDEASLNDSGYLRGLRGIRGRSSYKHLHDIKLTNPNANRPRPAPTAATIRPMGTVVGRKRKPSPSPPRPARAPPADACAEAREEMFLSHGKRMRLLDRLAMPFRRSVNRRAAEIVGINSDLPLTAPVASTSFATFDPESMKLASALAPVDPTAPVATPLPPPPTSPLGAQDADGKRCIVM